MDYDGREGAFLRWSPCLALMGSAHWEQTCGERKHNVVHISGDHTDCFDHCDLLLKKNVEWRAIVSMLPFLEAKVENKPYD
jgi:hypothetical protein